MSTKTATKKTTAKTETKVKETPMQKLGRDINKVLAPEPLLDLTVKDDALKADIVECFPGITLDSGLSEDSYTLLKEIGWTGKAKKIKAAVSDDKTDKKSTKAPRASKAKEDPNELFTFLKLPEKGPKQMVQILEILQKKPLTRSALLEKMTAVIKTKQPIDRILGYYHNALVSGKLVKVG